MFELVWPDILAVALGLYAINSAIHGELRTYRRCGGHLTFYRFHSAISRLGCALVGLVILSWVVVDLRRKFPHGR